ncbi:MULTISPECIES: citrate transporter [Rhodococcus]|uniref:citrate transporter n=1 Tax=Rhodococcus TaxID=1827 RepID=UPI00029B27F5|nr:MULTISPECIES: citrate transporter [Rhodococcus]WKK11770.1 hypothetical protein QYN14_24345 [Rhodococcus ruber]
MLVEGDGAVAARDHPVVERARTSITGQTFRTQSPSVPVGMLLLTLGVSPAGRHRKVLLLVALSMTVVGVALGPIPSDCTAPSHPSPPEEYR